MTKLFFAGQQPALVIACLLLTLPAPCRGDYLGKNTTQWQQEFVAAKDAKAKRNAAFALGKLGTEAQDAVPTLANSLRSDKEDPAVRETVAYSLGQIVSRGSNEEVVKLLAQLASSKIEERIKRSAVVALGHCAADNADTRTALDKALRDSNASVRQNAAWALGEVCQRSDDLPLASLQLALRDGDKLVKRDAALALGKIITYQRGGAPEAEQRERQRLAKVRDQARQAIPDLIACVDHKYVELRKAACSALINLVDPEQKAAAAALAKACGDEDVEVRRNAALAVANIGGPGARPAVPVLLDALRSGDVELRRLAALAFRGLGNEAPDAVPDLLKAVAGDPDLKVRTNAALGLGGFQKSADKVVPTLVERVNDGNEDVEVRVAAAMSLQRLGLCDEAVKAIPALVAVLKDPKQPARVRERILWAFRVHREGLLDHEAAVNAMKGLLTEPGLGGADRSGKMLRYDAAYLLSVLGPATAPEEVFQVLQEFLDDKSIRIFTGIAVDTAVDEGKRDSAVTEAGTADGRIMAVAALSRLGKRVSAYPEIIERVRRLRDATREEKLRAACDKLLKELGVK